MNPRILVVDDHPASVEPVVEILEREGYEVLTASRGREALSILNKENVDVVITDLKMPDLSGLELLEYVRDKHPYTQVILLTAYGTVDSAVEAMSTGAVSYLQKPIKIDILRQTVKNALEKRILFLQNINLREQLDEKFGFANIIGTSKPMLDLFDKIKRVAPTNVIVLITGETGVGKDLIANAIHNHSRRRDKPYKTVNCATLYRELLESELFGHERGAFTGAIARRRGVFEQADGGMLFLDEVGEMGTETQVKFLRVLEGHEFTRVGGEEPIRADVRIIAATNKDLEEAVKNKEFRADLYHRLNRFPLHVPPLRERREDIPLLASAFIKEFSREHDSLVTRITAEAMEYLKNADWPGNVRELRNVIETAVILATTDTIGIKDLSPELQDSTPVSMPISDETVGRVGMTMEEIEKDAIRKTLDETDGNKTKAAQILKIGLRTLHRKLQSYSLSNKADGEENNL